MFECCNKKNMTDFYMLFQYPNTTKITSIANAEDCLILVMVGFQKE